MKSYFYNTVGSNAVVMLDAKDVSKKKLADGLFLENFNSQDPQNKINLICYLNRLPLIFRLAENHPEFKAYCQNTALKGFWGKVWANIGGLFTSFFPAFKGFYPHQALDAFELSAGAYFFYYPLQMKDEFKKNFTPYELEFIRIARNYKSIHAIQRYNEYRYYIADLNETSDSERENLLKEAIRDCKSVYGFYGTYGCLLLLEAYVRYSLHLAKDPVLNSQRLCQMKEYIAIVLKQADQIFPWSTASIYNASFAQGLGTSNSQGIDTPSKIEGVLSQYSLFAPKDSHMTTTAHQLNKTTQLPQ